MEIGSLAQKAVDIIAKLGPMSIAVVVYWANQRQTSWTNDVSQRAAEVEDQKLRLALLDRRLVAIEAVRDATQEFHAHGAATPDVVEKIYQALRVAESVFDDPEEASISACLADLIRWRVQDRAREHWRDRDDNRLQVAVDAMMALEATILIRLETLRVSLRTAARVRQIPMIPRKPTILDRLLRSAS